LQAGFDDHLRSGRDQNKLNVVAASNRFYADPEESDKACAVCEKDIASLGDVTRRSVFVDLRLERSLMDAAIQGGHSELAKTLLDASPSDLAKHFIMIRKGVGEKNLAGAKAVFEAATAGGAELNYFVHNVLLDARANCQDLNAAEDVMDQTMQAGMIDVISFNALIKAYLQRGQLEADALVDFYVYQPIALLRSARWSKR
jgi:hypothetical protein